MSEIRIGMRADEFMTEYKERYEYLVKQKPLQAAKIFDFWHEDADQVISNEVEKAILEGFLSDSGVVKMPQGDPKSKVQTIKNCDVYESESTYSLDSRLDVQQYNGGQLVQFKGSNDKKCVYIDMLFDKDNDGIADERITGTMKINDECKEEWNLFRDINMDGRFDEKLD